MSVSEFECLEQQFIQLIGEFETISISESRLRENIRSECQRAETAEAGKASAERDAAEARNAASASSAAATQAAKMLQTTQENLVKLQVQVELQDRQRELYEERYTEMSSRALTQDRELEQLRPVQKSYSALQRQYTELQERIKTATEEARNEVARLESELRRVERCVGGGQELRERARLAAAAHARERRLVAAELKQTTQELNAANAEIARLGVVISELELRTFENKKNSDVKNSTNHDTETLSEVRAALEYERTGIEKLEKALAAALADNAILATNLNKLENTPTSSAINNKESNESVIQTNIGAIDSFLAE